MPTRPPRARPGCRGRRGRSRRRALPGVAALVVEGVDLALERLEVLEALVDAGEADVGDLVDRAELLHRQRARPSSDGTSVAPAERSSASIASAAASAAPRGHRPTGQRLAQAGGELVAIELLARPVALDDDEPGGLDALVGREAHRAGGALAATADRGGVVEVARVDDPGLALTALGAAHRSPVGRSPPLGVVV